MFYLPSLPSRLHNLLAIPLIVVNQEEDKEEFNNTLISTSGLITGSYDPKIINL